jgi:hypothetical protein
MIFKVIFSKSSTHKESNMNTQRLVGLVLLVIGIVVLIMGFNASHSVADQVSNTFTGRFTHATTWYILAGVASALIGGVMLLTVPRSKIV